MAATRALTSEIWGGLAAMLVALPSAIAYGMIIYSVLGPEYAARGAGAGVLGTIAIGIVAPLFGGTQRLVSAPCAPAAAVLAALAVQLASTAPASGPESIVAALAIVGLLAGVLQLVFAATGGGRLIKYIPYPVVAGYLSGVGVLIFFGQVHKLFGVGKAAFPAALAEPAAWSVPSLAVGLVTIVVTVLAPRLTRRLPATILGLGAGMLAYLALSGINPQMRELQHNLLVVGPIAGPADFTLAQFGTRFASVTSISLDQFRALLFPSLALAVLLSIDTLKTCVVVDALTRTRHHSNRELRGQGLGNLASALVGGMPGAGQLGSTLVNLNSGGSTKLSGLLEGVFALAAFLFLGPLVAWVPLAGLAGILIVVAVRMVDWKVFELLRQRSTRLDFAVVASVVATAIGYDLIAAAGVGVGLAILLFLREQMQGSVVRLKTSGSQTFSRKRRLPEEHAVLQRLGAGTVICELQGSLFFGTTDQLIEVLTDDLKQCRFVVLDLRRVQSVDFTAAHLLEQIEVQLGERGGLLLLSNLPAHLPSGQDLQHYFDQVGLVRPARHVKVFDQQADALEWIEDQLLAGEGFLPPAEAAPLELEQIDLLKGFDAATLAALRNCIEERSPGDGASVFLQGDTSDEIFLIRRGSVKIVLRLADGRVHHLVTFARGDFFGDLAFLDHAVRSAEAVAAGPVDLYSLSRARFDAVVAQHPQVGTRVLARLARALAVRLRQTDTALRSLVES